MKSEWIYLDIVAFAIVAVLTGIIIPKILLIAHSKQLFDEVDSRKIHKGAIPRLGGIAFFPAILFAILLIMSLCATFLPRLMSGFSQNGIISLCYTGCAVIVLYLVGLADDLVGTRYRWKFVAQIVSASLIALGGIYIDNLQGLLGIYGIPAIPAYLLTLLLAVFIINSINLIDGIDGLASGLSGIVCAFYGYIFQQAGLHIFALIAFSTLGVLVPFFYYNVFGNAEKHKKIFMGDTGSLTIGLILAICSIRICRMDSLDLVDNTAVAAFAPLLIPCCDVVRVYLHRVRCHRNPFLPDKCHIHHKLLALGLHQHVALPIIIGTSLILTLFNYSLSTYLNINILIIIDILLWITINVILSRAIRRRGHRIGQRLWD